MAPEQADGKPADAAADRYALGVIAYEMVTGRTPYSGGPPLGVLLAHGKEPLPLPTKVEPRVGPATERVLLRALAVDPKERKREELLRRHGDLTPIDRDLGALLVHRECASRAARYAA